MQSAANYRIQIEDSRGEKRGKGCASDSRKLCAINMAYDCSEFDGICEQIIIVHRGTTNHQRKHRRTEKKQREPGNENRSRRRRRIMAAAAGRGTLAMAVRCCLYIELPAAGLQTLAVLKFTRLPLSIRGTRARSWNPLGSLPFLVGAHGPLLH